jgi:hypothetical protein
MFKIFDKINVLLVFGLLCIGLQFCSEWSLPAQAISGATPWSSDVSYQSLVYGSSTPHDIQLLTGKPPDDIVQAEQMYPIIQNYIYYAKGQSGPATVFVFENNLLVGLYYKSSDNQYIDLSYFLQDNGDRLLNSPILGNMYPYYLEPPMYWLNNE